MSSLTQGIVESAQDDDAATQATLDSEIIGRRMTNLKERAGRLSTKFHDPRFIRVADYNYLMVPGKAVRRNQLPPLWGLLAPTPTPHAVIEAPRTGGSRPTHMYAAVLRAIARSNTRDMMRAHGVQHTRKGRSRPQVRNASHSVPSPSERGLGVLLRDVVYTG